MDNYIEKFYLIFILILIGFTTNAQTKLGFKTGLNFAKAVSIAEDNTDDQYESKMIPGLALGLVLEWEILEKIALRPEILYSMKGSKSEGYNSINRAQEKHYSQMNYLELPVNMVLKIKRLHVFAGPYAAVFLSGSYQDELDVGPRTYKASGKIKATKKIEEIFSDFAWTLSWDFGIKTGLGFEIFNNMDLSIHYEWGFYNKGPDYYGKDSEEKSASRVINFSLTYFPAGLKLSK